MKTYDAILLNGLFANKPPEVVGNPFVEIKPSSSK